MEAIEFSLPELLEMCAPPLNSKPMKKEFSFYLNAVIVPEGFVRTPRA